MNTFPCVFIDSFFTPGFLRTTIENGWDPQASCYVITRLVCHLVTEQELGDIPPCLYLNMCHINFIHLNMFMYFNIFHALVTDYNYYMKNFLHYLFMCGYCIHFVNSC